MNTDMLAKKMQDLNQVNLSESLITEFSQLIRFIEGALKSAIKEEPANASESLTTSLIALRDYMQSALTQDGYRKLLLSELLQAANHPEVEEERIFRAEEESPKKNLDLDQG